MSTWGEELFFGFEMQNIEEDNEVILSSLWCDVSRFDSLPQILR